MGYASFSEDIQKRHESEVHDLMRELEAGHLSETRQKHVLPEFRSLVQKLGELLSDPAQPAAMRLLNLRGRARNLEFEVEQLKEKNVKLGATNGELNERIRYRDRDVENALKAVRTEKIQSEKLEEKISDLTAELTRVRGELTRRDQRITELEALLMQAQVDVQYRK